jgi:hypothetical protein
VRLTATNHFGVREGASVQNLFTLVKLGASPRWGVRAVAAGDGGGRWSAPLPAAPLSTRRAARGALIATLWTYDGWYALTFSRGRGARSQARPAARAAARRPRS